MSFHLEGPGVPVIREPVSAIQEMYSYLTRTISQLNYALGFLDLPDASPSSDVIYGQEGRVAGISARSTNAQTPSAKAVFNYATPQSRTVNGHSLTEDVTITAQELGAEEKKNRVTEITEEATDDTYPTAKAVYDYTATGDRVLIIGQQGGWTYRKWESGVCEAFGFNIETETDPITPSPGVTPPYVNEAKISIPAPLFIDSDYAAFVEFIDSGGNHMGTVFERTTINMFIQYLAYNTIGTAPKVNIYLIKNNT